MVIETPLNATWISKHHTQWKNAYCTVWSILCAIQCVFHLHAWLQMFVYLGIFLGWSKRSWIPPLAQEWSHTTFMYKSVLQNTWKINSEAFYTTLHFWESAWLWLCCIENFPRTESDYTNYEIITTMCIQSLASCYDTVYQIRLSVSLSMHNSKLSCDIAEVINHQITIIHQTLNLISYDGH